MKTVYLIRRSGTGSNIVDEGAGLDEHWVNRSGSYSQTPAADSRVIDGGTCRLATDQRGMARPSGGGCDIGAIEFGAADVVEPSSRWLWLPLREYASVQRTRMFAHPQFRRSRQRKVPPCH